MQVWRNDGSELLTSSEEFSITIELVPSASIDGLLSHTTTNKIAEFDSLKIKASGNYMIKAICAECFDENSESFIVDDIKLDNLVVEVDNYSPSAYFYINVKVYIRDQADDPWLSNVSVELKESTLFFGTSVKSTSLGLAEFQIYFYNSGTQEILCKVETLEKTFQVNVLKNLLKITDISPIVRDI